MLSFLTILLPTVLNFILKQKHTRYTFVFHYMPQIKYFYTGPRSPGPRSPSKNIDLGRGVPGRNGFGPRSPGTNSGLFESQTLSKNTARSLHRTLHFKTPQNKCCWRAHNLCENIMTCMFTHSGSHSSISWVI